MSDFYVGYLPKAPEGLRRWIRRIVFALLGGAGLCAVLLVFGQQPFADSRFEYLQYRDYEGWIVERPHPTLLTNDARFLLVAPGKHGAVDLVRGFDQRRISLKGSLIQRGGDRMLELAPDSIRSVGGSASPDSGGAEDLGNVTLSGEIVDSKCYLGVMNPGNGKVHRDCAVRCLSGAIPPAFIVKDASGVIRTLLLSGVQNHELLDLVTEPVKIRGRLLRSGRTLSLEVERSGNRREIIRY